MEHSIFMDKYKANEIAVDIDRNKAGFMYEKQGVMPQKLRTKQANIRAVAFGSILVGLALFFFAPWWAGVAVLLIALYMFPQVQKQAAKGVLEASLQNSQIYEIAVQNHVLKVRELT